MSKKSRASIVIVGLAIIAASSATAQPVAEVEITPDLILRDLEQQGPIDRVRSWPIDWNRDEHEDFVVQVAYWLGGNAVGFGHRIYIGNDTGFSLSMVLEIDGVIRSVTQTEIGIEVENWFYVDGDGRCCPTGMRTLSFHP